jgi:hypothetical protein
MRHHHTATVLVPSHQTWPAKEFPLHPDGVIFGVLLILSWLVNLIQWIRSIKVRRPPKLAPRPSKWEMPSTHWRN